ncbi:hypothetical protein Pyn_13677 [Prunus yedoensis var. nudiflora]|uniref:Uncharacterized protein n=1 Tax=Prunus yedoensis var. nudiflora TaxID=2094558 RepID=A0A314YR13_PRUYE|nr:hypothetical protein Pyn_13677 [Prunus yedoensis var. nudiflora]
MTTVNFCSDHGLTVTDIVVHNLYDSKYVGGVAVRTQNEKWQRRIGTWWLVLAFFEPEPVCPGTTIRTRPCPSKLFVCGVNSFPFSILLCSSSASVTEYRSATPAVSCIGMGLSAEIASLLLWRYCN